MKKNDMIMIKDICKLQQIEDFLNLQQNESINNSEILLTIDWSVTLRLLKITGRTITIFNEYNVNLFKIKIRAKKLPTLDNLIKRKPHVYKDTYNCSM